LIVLPMSNWAPVLVVEGVVLVEVVEVLDGPAVLFVPAQPATSIARTTADSAHTSLRMAITTPPD
jgi:hypothetical protein